MKSQNEISLNATYSWSNLDYLTDIDQFDSNRDHKQSSCISMDDNQWLPNIQGSVSSKYDTTK